MINSCSNDGLPYHHWRSNEETISIPLLLALTQGIYHMGYGRIVEISSKRNVKILLDGKHTGKTSSIDQEWLVVGSQNHQCTGKLSLRHISSSLSLAAPAQQQELLFFSGLGTWCTDPWTKDGRGAGCHQICHFYQGTPTSFWDLCWKRLKANSCWNSLQWEKWA